MHKMKFSVKSSSGPTVAAASSLFPSSYIKMPGRGRGTGELLPRAGTVAVIPGCAAARESFSLPLKTAADGGHGLYNICHCFPKPCILAIVRVLICSAAGVSPRNHYGLILLLLLL